MMRALIVLALAASSAAMAQTFPFAGVLETADGPVDGLVDIQLSIVDSADASLWTETQSGVVVVDGVFAIDVGAATALPPSLPASAQLALTIDDDALRPIPLARLIQASGAVTAARATSAATANTLAGVGAADVATRSALAGPGGPAVSFANIAGVQASVLDGDQGTEVRETSGDLSVSQRRLDLANVSGTRLASGSVNGSRLVAGSAQVADNAITTAKLADRGMTRSNFAEAVTAREVKTVAIFVQQHAACGSGFTTGACVPATCAAGKQTECDGTGCSSPAPLALRQCLNTTKVGELVVEQ
jgi:hypothetical protein